MTFVSLYINIKERNKHSIIIILCKSQVIALIILAQFFPACAGSYCQRTPHKNIDSKKKALRHVNATCLCLGQKIPDHYDDTIGLDNAVSGSRFVCIKSSNGVSTSLISNSCLLLIPGGSSACEACQYAFKLCTNRKRKRLEQTELAGPMREDCMNGAQPSTSIKEKPTGGNLEDEVIHEMLSFDKSDSDDLLRITEEISLKNNIPEDMELLWEMQMKQLASKSANGHRWHPRFVIKLL